MYKFYMARVSTKQGTQGAEYIQTFRKKEIILKTFEVLYSARIYQTRYSRR